MKEWDLSFGFYPGILTGFRTYKEANKNNHVLYIPFIDVCLTTYNILIAITTTPYMDLYIYIYICKQY